jgi:hypothetical protein
LCGCLWRVWLASCRPVKRAANDRTGNHAPRHLNVSRGCGAGAVLGGALFVAWGYLDTPGVSGGTALAVRALSFVVPGLFLAGVAGMASIAARGGRGIGTLGWAGIVLALAGSVLGVVDGIADGDPAREYLVRSGWPAYLSLWLFLLLAALTIVGLAAVPKRPHRALGVMALAMGWFGWCYYLTDHGAVLEARTVHVVSGLLFSLAWVALGAWVWARGARH